MKLSCNSRGWKIVDDGKELVILLGCGSYNPITNAHLRMFEVAADVLEAKGRWVVGGFLSPVADAYGKAGLAKAHHRVHMCRLAVADNPWLEVSEWESSLDHHSRTADVLTHIRSSSIDRLVRENGHLDRAALAARLRVFLLCGADMLASFNAPGLWAESDMMFLAGPPNGIVVLSRLGTDLDKTIAANAALTSHRDNLVCCSDPIPNDISSTRLRQSVQNALSIRYCTPDPVVSYIQEHHLFLL